MQYPKKGVSSFFGLLVKKARHGRRNENGTVGVKDFSGKEILVMARYYADQALGMLETIGMVPALEACDKMLKAAEVELLSYENVGSTLVTMFIKGDVAAVKSSIAPGSSSSSSH